MKNKMTEDEMKTVIEILKSDNFSCRRIQCHACPFEIVIDACSDINFDRRIVLRKEWVEKYELRMLLEKIK